MAFHREQVERELIAGGMSADEARYAAMRQLGNLSLRKSESHEVVGFSFESVAQDLRFALRQLRKAPGFTIVAVLTLALGIGAATAMFSVIYATVLRPLPFPGPDRIMFLADGLIVKELTDADQAQVLEVMSTLQ